SEPQRARAITPPEIDEALAVVTGAAAGVANDADGDGQTDDVIVLSDDEAAAAADAEAVALPDWEWVTGAPGHTLDLDASIPAVIAALTSTESRVAELVLTETPPPVPSMADLERILDNQLMSFPGFAAVYVHDLTRGDEAAVDADVSFSGMSTLKIGIATAVMRKLPNGIRPDDPVSYEVGQWLDYALGESNNYAANLLLRYIGDGNTTNGTRVFTDFMRSLGMDSTYMQSGYDFETQLAEIPTPGNQQSDWDADPDTNLQSTPREMGRILSAIWECTQNRGLLIERFAGEVTPDECMQILFDMTHDQFRELVWGGLPEKDTRWIVHKHGFAFESHSD
ncbi:MAG: serine hydrolase, partial [Caldilineaceae bacterium]